jgi:tetratricopeptide (TPR) repeat protein
MAKYTRDLRRERNEALVARQQAELARIEAEQVGSFLVELFEAPDPWEAPAGLGPPTAETLLARGVEKISTELAEQPEVRLRLLTAMASAYLGLGDYEQALALQQQVVELARELYPEDDPQRSQSLYDLARVHQHRREHRSAEEFYRQALAIQQRQPEPDDLAIARSLHGLAQAKLQGGVPSPAVGPLLRAALSIRRARIADDHRDLLTNLNDLGLHLRYQGRQEEAEQVFRELAGRLEQAAAMGPDHPARATVLGNLALALWQQGKLEEAETVARQSQATMARALGEAHPYVAAANRMLVRVLKGRGKLQEAEPYARAALEIARAGGEERIDTALYRIDLGQLYLYLDPPGPGEALVRQGHETLRRLLGEDDPRTIQALLSLAEASHRAGRRQEAARRYREALEAAERHLGEDDELTARVLLAAAQFDLDQGQGEAAEEKSRRLLARFEEHPPSWPWLTEDARSVLGAALGQQGRWAEAEPLLTGAHGVLEKLLGASSPDTRRARERLADFQRRRGASGPGGEPRQPVS